MLFKIPGVLEWHINMQFVLQFSTQLCIKVERYLLQNVRLILV